MPHFIIDCSATIVKRIPTRQLLRLVHDTAASSGLFEAKDIKVRLRSFEEYTIGTDDCDFIHVFANIMEGRTTEQKKALSESIVGQLKALFPAVPVISMNVRDFEKDTYCNRNLIP